MTLINVVRQNLNKTNEELITFLNEAVVLSIDNSLYTIAQVKVSLGNNIDAVRLVCGTIKAVSDVDPLVWAFGQKLFSTGISFSDTETQTMIATLAHPSVGNWPDSVRDAILSLGIKKGKRFNQLGLGSLPTSEDIDGARTRISEILALEELSNILSSQMNETSRFVGSAINDIITPAISNNQSVNDIKVNIDISKIDELISNLNTIKGIIS